MDGSEQQTRKSLEYQIAARIFDAAFTACARLRSAEKELLLREIGKRVLQSMPEAPAHAREAMPDVEIETERQNPHDEETDLD